VLIAHALSTIAGLVDGSSTITSAWQLLCPTIHCSFLNSQFTPPCRLHDPIYDLQRTSWLSPPFVTSTTRLVHFSAVGGRCFARATLYLASSPRPRFCCCKLLLLRDSLPACACSTAVATLSVACGSMPQLLTTPASVPYSFVNDTITDNFLCSTCLSLILTVVFLYRQQFHPAATTTHVPLTPRFLSTLPAAPFSFDRLLLQLLWWLLRQPSPQPLFLCPTVPHVTSATPTRLCS
jgi:hypothetical protein